MNSGSKVLLGVLAGAAAGAILGVLFAPDKGTETRRRLNEGGRDVASNLKDKFSDLVDGIADKYEAAREGASDLIEKGKQKVGLSTNQGGVAGSTGGSYDTGGNTGGPSYTS
ncbi:YtxH domain-containing protein [Segetibacter sp. 3557_3]|uniref:YtxH domain-containing protein n=1 Tax=Segetibacter sp. 3557_3 TaxID=2547429 RepID=UPI001058F1FD|nr:YtxH domain-containing protein [Segetibacter sp. 3557_3]TDH26196.1 YtxH domain-containing protein [Segetibacter sp. 3557_3]